jgi:anti-sigma B factor antagonist
MRDAPLGTPFSSEHSLLRDDAGLIVLSGEVDISTAPRFREDLLRLVDAGVRHIVVDLTQVTFIDSTALGVLIGGVRRLHPHEGRMVLVAAGRPVLRALTLTGLDRVFTICPTREQAVAAL